MLCDDAEEGLYSFFVVYSIMPDFLIPCLLSLFSLHVCSRGFARKIVEKFLCSKIKMIVLNSVVLYTFGTCLCKTGHN